MTEDEWADAEELDLMPVLVALSPRKQRLLAAAVVRSLGRWAADPAIAPALEAADRFADTGKSKAALKRAWVALQDARVALGDPHADPARWRAEKEGLYLGLWTAGAACSAHGPAVAVREAVRTLREAEGLSKADARRRMYPLYREMAGPTPPVVFDPDWRSSAAVQLAARMYDARDFALMPILADAIEDAGCDSPDVLAHCRDPRAVHVRGCWVVDLVLGKS